MALTVKDDITGELISVKEDQRRQVLCIRSKSLDNSPINNDKQPSFRDMLIPKNLQPINPLIINSPTIKSEMTNKLYTIVSAAQGLLDTINTNDSICLWKYKNSFYYRSAKGNEVHKGNKKEVSQIIEDFLGEYISIVSIQDLTKSKMLQKNTFVQFILTSQIPVIECEVFDPKEKEFFTIKGILYKNSYQYTKYLEKRFTQQPNRIKNHDYFIIDFLESMTSKNAQEEKNQPLISVFLKWLSHYFQTMTGSNIALMLNGSKYITEDILWKRIIQPIFGNEPYTVTIDDEMLKKPIDVIVKGRVFFHLGDFTPNDENVKKVNQLLHAILIDKYIKPQSMSTIPVHGRLLITSNHTLWTYIKDYHALFEYIEVQHEEVIISDLSIEAAIELALKFTHEQIDFFSNLLAICNKDEKMRSTVVYKMPKAAKTKPLEEAIKEFIYAIKNHCNNIDYFKKIKENDIELYDELIYNFKEDMIARQLLVNYFNIIYPESPFNDNKNFLKTLKKEDDFFSSIIDNNPQHNLKKRFIISCEKAYFYNI